MSVSSLSSPPRATEVSSSRRPQMAACDKNVGSSSRQAARPAREDQRTIRTRAEPSRTGAPGRKVPRPAKLSPRGSRRSGHLPFANSTMVRTVPTPTPCRGVGHGRSRRTMCRHRARRRQWIPVPPCSACSRYLSRAAEPWTFTCPSSPVGPRSNPGRRRGRRISPCAVRGARCRR
jgi:hypothetical protein